MGAAERKAKDRRLVAAALTALDIPDKDPKVVARIQWGGTPGLGLFLGLVGLATGRLLGGGFDGSPRYVTMTESHLVVFRMSQFRRRPVHPKIVPLSRLTVAEIEDTRRTKAKTVWLRWPDGESKRLVFDRDYLEEANAIAGVL